jgi:Nuclease-related domain
VWAQGARGEEAVATSLDALAPERVLALHDRRMRDGDGRLTKANIDHLAVAAGGV